MSYYFSVLTKNFANFQGRARRKEYWMFVLFNMIAGFILAVISVMTKLMWIPTIYSIIILIPSIALMIRRLHDIDKSWGWFCLSFIPIIGWIWLLILTFKEGDSGPNRFGEDPKGIAAAR